MPNSATEPQQPTDDLFDIGEENPAPEVKPEEVFDVGQPTVNAVANPDYAKRKAEKTALGIGADPDTVLQQFSVGAEQSVRQAAAANEALRQRQDRNTLLIETATKLNRPITEEDLNQFDAFSKINPEVDPETVLEEAYGKAFSSFVVNGGKNLDVKQKIMDTVPDASVDLLDAVGHTIAKREITSDIQQELKQLFDQKAEGITVGNALVAGAKGVANALTRGFGKVFVNEEGKDFSLVGDFSKMFLPTYANVVLGGLNLSVGDSLQDQYTYFMLLPPSQFKKEFREVVNRLSAENLPLAQQYVDGFMSYSRTDQGMDNWLGYFDWMGTVFSSIAAGRKLSKVGQSSQREIDAFTKAMKDTAPPRPYGPSRGGFDKGNRLEAPGVAEARDFKNIPDDEKYAVDDSGFFSADEASPDPVPPKTEQETVQDAKDFHETAKAYSKAANEERGEDALTQMGAIDEAAAELAHKEMRGAADGLDPFDDGLELRDKLPNVYYPSEIGRDGGSLPVSRKNVLVAHAKAHAARMLQIIANNHGVTRLTDEQLAESIRVNKDQMTQQYHGVNDAILDVAHGGGFRVWTPEEQLINNHTLEMRLGLLPETPTAKPTKPVPAPKPPVQVPPSGDEFLDAVNDFTARKGRLLVRDLYDQMKKSDRFKGTFAEFRQKVDDLRKGKKISMSPHAGSLPDPSPPMKSKNLTQGQTTDSSGIPTVSRRADVDEVFNKLLKDVTASRARAKRELFSKDQDEGIKRFYDDDFKLPKIVFKDLNEGSLGHAYPNRIEVSKNNIKKLIDSTGHFNAGGYLGSGLKFKATLDEAIAHVINHEIAHTLIPQGEWAVSDYEKLIDAVAYQKTFGQEQAPKAKQTLAEQIGPEPTNTVLEEGPVEASSNFVFENAIDAALSENEIPRVEAWPEIKREIRSAKGNVKALSNSKQSPILSSLLKSYRKLVGKPLTAEDTNRLIAYLDKFESRTEKLSGEAQSAIFKYSLGGQNSEDRKSLRKAMRPLVQKYGHTFDSDITVYRGYRDSPETSDIIATSIEPGTAREFAQERSGNKVARIIIPKGTKVLDLRQLRGDSYYEGESEIILEQGRLVKKGEPSEVSREGKGYQVTTYTYNAPKANQTLSEQIGPEPTNWDTNYLDNKQRTIIKHYGLGPDAWDVENMPLNLVDNPKAVTEFLAANRVAHKIADIIARDAFAIVDKGKTRAGKPDEDYWDDLAQQEAVYGTTIREMAKGLGQEYDALVRQAFKNGEYRNATLKRLAQEAYRKINEFKALTEKKDKVKLTDLASAFKLDITPKLKTGSASNENLPKEVNDLIEKQLPKEREHFKITPKSEDTPQTFGDRLSESYLKQEKFQGDEVRVSDLKKDFPELSVTGFHELLKQKQKEGLLYLSRIDSPELRDKADKETEVPIKNAQGRVVDHYHLVAFREQPKPKASVPEDIGEEGNYASEFRRDQGYGNTTFRNRLIDSEYVVKPRGKYNSPVRAHYIEPPKGFEQPTASKKPPSAVGNYPTAKPQTEDDLMVALNGLMEKVGATGNNDLWHKLAKYLDNIEKRQLERMSPGVDNRELDMDILGSPYSKVPAPENQVEKRTLRVDPKTGKTEPFRNAATPEADIITGRKGRTGLSFVGRQYTNQEKGAAYTTKIKQSDANYYAKLERDAYAYLNKFAASEKVPYEVKIGKPTAQLFTKRDQAAFYGVNVYGLSPNQFRIRQQGDGYYISITKILDETFSSARDLQITTNNKTQDGLLDALFGTFISPSAYVGDLSRVNRKTVTYGPQEMHRIVQEAAETIVTLPRKDRDELGEILIANRDFKYIDADGDVRRGRFNETFGDFEREFQSRFRKLPTERQTSAYFDYVRYYELDLAMRDLALVRDMGRLGLERTSLGYHTFNDAGQQVRKQSRAFSSREIDDLPFDDADGENWSVFVYDPHQKKGDFYLRTELTKEIRDDIAARVGQHGYKILELGNPLEKPMRGIAKTDDVVNFLVVKDYEKRKYNWSNIPKRPGGHVSYQDPFFISQPIIRRTERTGTLRHIYEGDEHLLNLTTEAQAKKLLPHIETARLLLKENRIEELERHLAKNTPWELDQWVNFFKPQKAKDGSELSPKFNIDDEFTWRSNGRNTLDMAHSKDIDRKYPNFVNGIRSKYNLFASNVDKKFLGQRDPDLPAVTEYMLPDKEPAFVLSSPRLIDPWETVNSSLANVIRSKYLNDFKTQAAENFIQEFYSVMKTPLGEMRRNPVFYLHNPVWDHSTDNLPKILAGKHVRQAQLHMIGTETTVGKALNWMYDRVSDGIYNRAGQGRADTFTDQFRNAQNPVDFARAMTFHTKLGLFNVTQAYKQSIHWTNIAAIEGPIAVANAMPQYWAARWLSLTEDQNMINGVAKAFEDQLKPLFPGFNAQRFVESYNELKRTGMYNVGGEYASRDDFFDPDVFQSGVGNFLDKGTFFFKEGERFQRLVAWFVAYDKWRAANPNKVMTNFDRASVLDRADLLTFRMARDSNANIQSGSFALPTQFFSYRWRMAELLWGKQLSRGQRASLILTNMALWGIPLGVSMPFIVDYYDDSRQAMLENGVDMDDRMTQALHDGIVSTGVSMITGEEYNVSKSFGPSGLNIVKEVFSEEGKLLEFALGATGSVVGDMLKTSNGVYGWVMNLADPTYEPPTAQDFVDFTKNVSTVSNAIRAYYMYNTRRYLTKNESLIINDATGQDALMAAMFGLTPSRVGDTFLMLKSLKEQKQAEDAAEKYAIKYLKRAVEATGDGDALLAANNLKKAKSAMIASGMPPDKWAGVIRKAYEGNEPLFDKVLKEFVEKSPADQKMERAIQRESIINERE